MSLEAAIQENTAALRELIALFAKQGRLTHGDIQEAVIVEEVTPAQAEKMIEEIPNAEPESTTPKSSEASVLTGESSSSAQTAQVSYEDVKKVTIKLSGIDRQKAVDVLAKFGCTKATQLAEGQWADYVAYARGQL